MYCFIYVGICLLCFLNDCSGGWLYYVNLLVFQLHFLLYLTVQNNGVLYIAWYIINNCFLYLSNPGVWKIEMLKLM